MMRGDILVITYWPLRNALISTYTLPYVRIMKRYLHPGSRVWLLTLSPPAQRENPEHRALQESLRKEGIISIDYTYSRFGTAMLLRAIAILSRLVFLCVFGKVRVIHTWCTPGGAIGWIVSKISGRPLVLDSCEPHAEIMSETGTWKRSSLPFRLLFALERKQVRDARGIIYTTSGMQEYVRRTYGITRNSDFIKPACVDLELFRPQEPDRSLVPGLSASDIVCVYAGKFGDLYLEKEVFDFFRVAREHWGRKFRVLLLTAHTEEEIRSYCVSASLDPSAIIRRFVPHHEVPAYMNLASFGICPMKPVPSRKYCTPIKNGEYWAMGLPVVITKDISVDSDIIRENNAGYVLGKLDEEEYRAAVRKTDAILQDPSHRNRIRALAGKYRNFSIAEEIYRDLYSRLFH